VFKHPNVDAAAGRSYPSFAMARTHTDAEVAQVMDALSRADRKLAPFIRKFGPFPTEVPEPKHPYAVLLRAIVYQQLAGAAAKAIFARVKALGADGEYPTPEEILRAGSAKLRRAGLSRQKIAAVKDLAKRTIDGTVPPLEKIRNMSEEQIVERLTKVHGIGEWSAQMFLMFQLRRPDVLPVHDYGLRKGFQYVYRLKGVPKPKAFLACGERWRPYRSIASWYLWRAVEAKAKEKFSSKGSSKKKIKKSK